MTPGPTRRLGPVELFVGAGVLAAAWGLIGRMVIPLGLFLSAVVAARIGFRTGGARLRPALVMSLSPLAPLSILLAIVLLDRTLPIPSGEGAHLMEVVVTLALGGLLLVDVLHGLFCIVSVIRPSAAGDRRGWCLCGLAAWASIASTVSFLYLAGWIPVGARSTLWPGQLR